MTIPNAQDFVRERNQKFKHTEKQLQLRKLVANPFYTDIMAYGGSRSGKTFEFLDILLTRAIKEPGSRHIVFRRYFNRAKLYIWKDTLPRVCKLSQPFLKMKWNHSDHVLILPNGSEIWVAGLDDGDRLDRLLGGEYSTEFFNESSEIPLQAIQLLKTRLAQKNTLIKKCFYDCNPPSKRHWTYQLFINKVDIFTNTKITNPDNYAVIQMNPADNSQNIDPDYINRQLMSLSERDRERFLKGMFQDDVEGGLWKYHQIQATRILPESLPELSRIAIGVDPAGSHNKKSDMTGIVVAGKSLRPDAAGRFHYYTLEDLTGRYTPVGWANVVKCLYQKWKADIIVAEGNYGGDMVVSTIHNADASLPVIKVNATRGKIVRAEPISLLMEHGEEHHVGSFPDLEDELTTYNPVANPDAPSPNRLDAKVWALTELSGGSNILMVR